MNQSAKNVVRLFPDESTPVQELPRCQILRLKRPQDEQGVKTEVIIDGEFKPLWGLIFRSLFVDAFECLMARMKMRRLAAKEGKHV